MKSVLLSINPKWCEMIANGKKTIEVRKTKPKLGAPFKCYIYECNWKENTMWSFKHKGRLGKVIGEFVCDCSDMSEIIVIAKDGKYRVTRVTDKAFYWKDLAYVGVFDRGDERTIYNVIYRDGKAGVSYAKRFSVTSVTRDKDYDITMGTPGSTLLWFSVNHNGEAETVRIRLRQKAKLKKLVEEYDFSTLAIKGRASRGNVVTKNQVQAITLKSAGVSTIGGKDIWFDEDIQKLNEDSRGLYLGQFLTGDHVLAIFKDGTYYTTSFDLSSRYQGELLKIEKFVPGKTYSALYWDASAKSFYIKRFSFEVNDNNPVSFIGDAKGSKLVGLTDATFPRFEVTPGGKSAHREHEIVEAEPYIAKKGFTAKGKKVSALEVADVKFIEPLPEPEPEPVKEPEVMDEFFEDEFLPSSFKPDQYGQEGDNDENMEEPTLF